jgi:hypothetical protein
MPAGSGKTPLVPAEVDPLELAHPERIEMEDAEGNVSLGHTLDEMRHRRLVVVGGERGREPQPERPGWGQGWPADEAGKPLQHFLGSRAIDDEVLERLARDAEADPVDPLCGDLELDPSRLVDEDAVASVGQVEGHILVGLFRAGTAIAVPHVDRLAVLDERAEAFAEAVDVLAHAERKSLGHEVSDRMAGVAMPAVARPFDRGHALRVAGRKGPAVGNELEAPRTRSMDARRHPTRLETRDRVIDLHVNAWGLAGKDREDRPLGSPAGVVRHANSDDIDRRGRQFDRQGHQIVHLGPILRHGCRRKHCHRVIGCGDAVDHGRIQRPHAITQQPVAVPELHESSLLAYP